MNNTTSPVAPPSPPPRFPPPPPSPRVPPPLPPTIIVDYAVLVVLSLVAGCIWCFCCCSCLRVMSIKDEGLKKRFTCPCIFLTIVFCGTTQNLFWFYLHPTAVQQGQDIIWAGALGDLLGVLAAFVCASACGNDEDVKRRFARRPPPRLQHPPPDVETAAADAPDVPVVAAVPIGALVVDNGAVASSSTAAAAPHLPMPPLAEAVDILRRELKLPKDATLIATIDAACEALSVEGSGTLIEKCRRCWALVGASAPGTANLWQVENL